MKYTVLELGNPRTECFYSDEALFNYLLKFNIYYCEVANYDASYTIFIDRTKTGNITFKHSSMLENFIQYKKSITRKNLINDLI